jgi:putative oxidoreductase
MQQKIQIAVRVLLGALFLFGGIAFFFTTPPPLTGDMATFFAGLSASKYFFYLLKFSEIFCGACLVSGFFVPLALVILAPISINIFMVHTFLEPSGIPMATAIGVAIIYLSFFSPSYSPTIKKLFVLK